MIAGVERPRATAERQRAVALIILGAACWAMASGCKGTPVSANPKPVTADRKPVTADPKPPLFREVVVHDPDVFRADGVYYIFGSHLGVARSTDLLVWDSIAGGVRDDNTVIPNVLTEMRAAFEWGQTRTFWAGTTVRMGDGKFYHYYCVCKGDSPRGAIGLAVSDGPAGPFKDRGVFLKSGMWGQVSPDGTVYDATIHPNAVDPHTFFDAGGRLWMVYGSYSGGIFILRMDERTGLPLPNQGYGRRLMGNHHSCIEAPYVLYNPDTKFYYMFLSFGGLGKDGGYQIRVARSRNPDGPYVDPGGRDMIDAHGPKGSFFDNAAIEKFGAKIVGNLRFDTPAGSWGYVSPGHNSAYRDPETGRCFIVFHTRFPGMGEGHQVRVHPLLFTSDGWPVVAPMRYAGETPQPVSAGEVAGDYDVVRLGRDIGKALASSTVHTLAPGGDWRHDPPDRLALTLDNVTYSGRLLRQWDALGEAWTLTFTGLSADGQALWAIRRR
jgi:arabinan endo-1,5-alpha-L-arabinosidase